MILLDTHIWIRWLLPSQPLPINLVEQIEQTKTVMVSAISCWEVVMLEKKQRIKLPLPVEQWLQEATIGSLVSVLPITCDISCLAGTLPEHHKDPADRIIIATALCHNLKLMSLDSIFPTYQELAEQLIVK
jgi:PIN domain nuclease of toxin-antitoxin system